MNPSKKKKEQTQRSDNEYQIQVNQTIPDELNDTENVADQQSDRENVIIENVAIENGNVTQNAKSKKDNDKNQPITIQIGIVSILILLVFVVGMLLLLYFFYSVMSKLL